MLPLPQLNVSDFMENVIVDANDVGNGAASTRVFLRRKSTAIHIRIKHKMLMAR